MVYTFKRSELIMKSQPNFWMNVTPDPEANCGPYNAIDDFTVTENDVIR